MFRFNHVPIIRSWRLRDVMASCWYVPWLQEGCQDRLAASASIPFDCSVVQVGFVVDIVALKQFSLRILQYFLFLSLSLSLSLSHTIRLQRVQVGFVVDALAMKQFSLLTTNCSWPPSCNHGTYQHKAIISRRRQLLLMMGTWLPETCWATIRREKKEYKKWHLVGFSYPHWRLK